MSNEQLKKAGLKTTLPRVKILTILEQSDKRHWSAEDVYQAFRDMNEDVSLATVYRVLTQFASAGIVRRHNFADGYSVFEMEQGEHHDHLVCIKCGEVQEFVDDIIESRQQMIAKQAGFQMTDHALNIYGICSHCQKT